MFFLVLDLKIKSFCVRDVRSKGFCDNPEIILVSKKCCFVHFGFFPPISCSSSCGAVGAVVVHLVQGFFAPDISRG